MGGPLRPDYSFFPSPDYSFSTFYLIGLWKSSLILVNSRLLEGDAGGVGVEGDAIGEGDFDATIVDEDGLDALLLMAHLQVIVLRF